MQIASLKAEKREGRGTRVARRLRKSGQLPAIVYGHGETPEQLSVNGRDLSNLLQQGSHLVALDVGGAEHHVLIKDVQFDHLGISVMHVDFTRVDLNERVTVSVPLEFRGTPAGVAAGGLLDPVLLDLEIECLVTEIPDSIRVNVSHLNLGDSLHVRDIAMPANMTAALDGDLIVCSVHVKAAAVEEVAAAADEEAAVQPEIIGRREKEEEEEAEKD